jgi:hypothetical protein
MSLHLSTWQDHEWPSRAHALITDPPFSKRTHTGMTPTRADGVDPLEADYLGIDEADAQELADRFAPMLSEWAIVFCDHVAYHWHARAWADHGWYVFGPVPFVKSNGSPRFAGDGPASAAEWIMIARPSKRVRDPGSRPGFYHGPVTGRDKLSRGAGHKPAWLLQALLRDYSKQGDLILDPFAGTATLGEVATRGRRRYEGTEIDPKAFDLGLARLDHADRSPDLPGLLIGSQLLIDSEGSR